MTILTTRAPAGEVLDLADAWHRLTPDERRCRVVIAANARDADALCDWRT
jgi:hypothetical protein